MRNTWLSVAGLGACIIVATATALLGAAVLPPPQSRPHYTIYKTFINFSLDAVYDDLRVLEAHPEITTIYFLGPPAANPTTRLMRSFEPSDTAPATTRAIRRGLSCGGPAGRTGRGAESVVDVLIDPPSGWLRLCFYHSR